MCFIDVYVQSLTKISGHLWPSGGWFGPDVAPPVAKREGGELCDLDCDLFGFSDSKSTMLDSDLGRKRVATKRQTRRVVLKTRCRKLLLQ